MTELQAVSDGELVFFGEDGHVINDGDPSGQILDLAPSPNGQVALTWNPRRNKAEELEVRARVFGSQAILVPLIRYSIQLGHGRVNWSQPAPNAVGAGGAVLFQEYVLPGRGMRTHVNARGLRITFRNVEGTPLGIGGAGAVKLQVSVQPVISECCHDDWLREQYINAVMGQPGAGGPATQFPAEATEWLVRSINGTPFVAGDAALQLFTITNGALGPVLDIATAGLDDWQPIPTLAASFQFWGVAAAEAGSVHFR